MDDGNIDLGFKVTENGHFNWDMSILSCSPEKTPIELDQNEFEEVAPIVHGGMANE